MRIDEVDSEVPGLAGGLQLLPAGAQPAGHECRGRVVVVVAAKRRIIDIADAEKVVEAVALDNIAILREWRVDGFAHLVEIGRRDATCPDRRRGSRAGQGGGLPSSHPVDMSGCHSALALSKIPVCGMCWPE